jgi:hypothetical protein
MVAGVAAGFVTWAMMAAPGAVPDFIYPWTAARHLVGGDNPYQALPGGLPFPFQGPLFYPLPTVLATVPVAWLPLPLAGALLFGTASAVLVWALMARGIAPIFVLLSGPFVVAAALGQWSPLVTIAAVMPAAGFLGVLKPNIGAAVLLARPSVVGWAGAAALLVASLAILPSWPIDWFRALQQLEGPSAHHPIPLMTLTGVPVIIAALRWRRWEARLLLLMACVPQVTLFADQLPLMLIPQTRREGLALSGISLGTFALVYLLFLEGADPLVMVAEPIVFPAMYWPCLYMVMTRPNEGTLYS